MKRLMEWHRDLMDDLVSCFGSPVYAIARGTLMKSVAAGYLVGVLL